MNIGFSFIDNFSIRKLWLNNNRFISLLLLMDHLILTKNFHLTIFIEYLDQIWIFQIHKMPSTIWNAVTLSFHWLRKCIYCLDFRYENIQNWICIVNETRANNNSAFWLQPISNGYCDWRLRILLIIIYVLKHENTLEIGQQNEFHFVHSISFLWLFDCWIDLF